MIILKKCMRYWPLALLAMPTVGGLSLAIGADRGWMLEHFCGIWLFLQAHPWAVGFAFIFRIFFLLPVSFLLFACGAIFGPALGEVIGVLGLVMGGTLEFLLARMGWHGKQGKPSAASPNSVRWRALLSQRPFAGLLTLRVAFVPFDMTNLLCAWISMPVSRFVLATAIGVVPTTWPIVNLGAVLNLTGWLRSGGIGMPGLQLNANNLLLSAITLLVGGGLGWWLQRPIRTVAADPLSPSC